jgi:hypothetical protein
MKTVLLKIRKMASDYLPGVYTRIGTEENPGTFRGGSGSRFDWYLSGLCT